MLDMAFSLVVPVVLGFFAGQYLDRKFPSSFPIWTISLTLLGIITGFWSIYKRYIK